MNTRTSKIIYWTGAILTSLWFGTSGFFELSHNKLVWDITQQLGYPAHFIYILGVAKLSGVAVLLMIAFVMVSVTYSQFRKLFPADYRITTTGKRDILFSQSFGSDSNRK
ncbi:DoxX family protein [Pseudoflavitalea rhizosphaerae]|uniref:DoxX family protein n=1 Tax=Pseudoflavitalea rhizosphaerae TaxID=1884793 RepID=UPI000F8D16D4|nr:DoxX family protein [Pseudoflavitalea rhizosphaerae]